MTRYRRKALSARVAGPVRLEPRPAVPRPAGPASPPARPDPSFLKEKIAPTIVTFLVLTVGGTLITSYFQFNQWRQATALSRSQESLKRGDDTAQRLFSLLSERHYYTLNVIGTWAEDHDQRHAEWMAKYRKSIEDWSLKSDAILARLHADLDDPVDTERQISEAELRKVSCQTPLIRQDVTAADGRRTLAFASGKTEELYSSRFMLAAIQYCFRNVSNTFFNLRTERARADLGPEDRKRMIQPLKDDMAHLLTNQNLLRRNILNQLRYLAENDAIPDVLTWAQGMISKGATVRPVPPAQARPPAFQPVAAAAGLPSGEGAW
ncbi:MAG TPA: hypothetical protein VF744_16210 [Beijerinckiaceae bacterium]|jgi:hypothetical protein